MYDVVVIGGGPAGMAAAVTADKKNADVLIIEREGELGGILKQCIHDGFGINRFKERLTGPEYAHRYREFVANSNVNISLNTFVLNIEQKGKFFDIYIMNETSGVKKIETQSIVLANGCRERTSKQIMINGTRPSGVYSAGTAQYLINIDGCLPCKECVILGSGDIGLIMARRLTLEGANVKGVYEVQSSPSGLTRNISQCLDDYNIPLHLNHTVTKVFGNNRVEAVEISKVDKYMTPIEGTEKRIQCDGVILSVGLIPENELAESLEIAIDKKTKGPIVDDNLMTNIPGIFSCGNSLHVNDLVDYVSDSGDIAGEMAAEFAFGNLKFSENSKNIRGDETLLYVVPQKVSKGDSGLVNIYFRAKRNYSDAKLVITSKGKEIFSKKYKFLKPPEMEEIKLDKSLITGDLALSIEQGGTL